MKKPIVTLKNWYVTSTGDPYTPPEFLSLVLNGDAYGHPKFPDGHTATTVLASIELRMVGVPFLATALSLKKSIRDGMIIETLNTFYKLSGVCPKYEKCCVDGYSYSVRV